MLSQKIQITLTPQEVAALSIKSKALGYNVTKYVKFIVSKEAVESVEEYPTYKMSKRLERLSQKALKEYREGKTITLKSVEDLKNL